MSLPDESDTKTDGHLQRDAMIRVGRVLKSLGFGQNELVPGVSVINLGENNYRVNVTTGTDVSSAPLPHSYFVVAGTDDGNILQGTWGFEKCTDRLRLVQKVACGRGNRIGEAVSQVLPRCLFRAEASALGRKKKGQANRLPFPGSDLFRGYYSPFDRV